jgi:hypothetical protein
LHDLAKEQKVAPMVVECINCEYYCHEDDANLSFDAELSDVKISLRMENKLHHMLHPDVMYYGSRMVQVSPLDHDVVIGISSQMVPTLTKGYCSIANHLLSTI